MSNHQRLAAEQFQSRLRNLADALYQEFVVPNPFMPPVLVTYNEYREFVDVLVESYFDFSLPSNLAQGPPANARVSNALNANVARPAPVPPITPPGPMLHPNFERAVRCAINTPATGERCCRASFRPYTLCSCHYRYYKVHNRLPPGGAVAPGRPHHTDVWPAPRPPPV